MYYVPHNVCEGKNEVTRVGFLKSNSKLKKKNNTVVNNTVHFLLPIDR
jgi:hypothetical protein